MTPLEHVEAAEALLRDAESFPPPSVGDAQNLYLGALSHALIAIAIET